MSIYWERSRIVAGQSAMEVVPFLPFGSDCEAGNIGNPIHEIFLSVAIKSLKKSAIHSLVTMKEIHLWREIQN